MSVAGDDDAHADHDAVVGTTRDELRKFIELRGEGLDDAKQVEHLKVIRRRLTIWTTLSTELAIQVLEESCDGSEQPAARSSLRRRLGARDVVFETSTHPSKELRRHISKIANNPGGEDRILFSW